MSNDHFCTGCGSRTPYVCDNVDCPEPPSSPRCEHCECVFVNEMRRFCHIVKGSGTPYMRWYMTRWPRHLPPPNSKEKALDVANVEPLIENMIDTVAEALSVTWDRGDALLVVAEIAIRMHNRDARAIDGWNTYVDKENIKRKRRMLQKWPQTYYTRQLTDDDKGKYDVHLGQPNA